MDKTLVGAAMADLPEPVLAAAGVARCPWGHVVESGWGKGPFGGWYCVEDGHPTLSCIWPGRDNSVIVDLGDGDATFVRESGKWELVRVEMHETHADDWGLRQRASDFEDALNAL